MKKGSERGKWEWLIWIFLIREPIKSVRESSYYNTLGVESYRVFRNGFPKGVNMSGWAAQSVERSPVVRDLQGEDKVSIYDFLAKYPSRRSAWRKIEGTTAQNHWPPECMLYANDGRLTSFFKRYYLFRRAKLSFETFTDTNIPPTRDT